MTAAKNLLHFTALAVWGALGAMLTLKVLFGAASATLGQTVIWWLWYAGLVAITTALVARFARPLSALGLHLAVLVLLGLLPSCAPLSALRFGVDLLGRS